MGLFSSMMGKGSSAASGVADKIKAGALVVDVRNPGEYKEGHYKNAKLVPVSEIGNRIGELGDKSKPVVVYCASGARSAMAAKILRANGFVDVTNAGGLDDMPA